jgi:hypothetical protein
MEITILSYFLVPQRTSFSIFFLFLLVLRKLNTKPKRHSFDIRVACDDQYTNNQESYEIVHVLGYTDSWEVKKPSQGTVYDCIK